MSGTEAKPSTDQSRNDLENDMTKLQPASAGAFEVPDSPSASAPPKAGSLIRIIRCTAVISLVLSSAAAIYFQGNDLPAPSPPTPASIPALTSISSVSRPVVPAVAPEKPALPTTRVPSFIPLENPDTSYAAAHPGWQRYESDSLEFRVFRDKDTVKALQVLSKQGKEITDSYLALFLAEIAGNEPFKPLSGVEKDGYLIEKGPLGNTAKIIVYRKKDSQAIQAFVVSYP